MNLDREIAEKVMGWHTGRLGTQSKMDPEDRGFYGKGVSAYGMSISEWKPSKNIIQAMKVEAEMFRRGYCVSIVHYIGEPYSVSIGPRGQYPKNIKSTSLPEAICKAALEALK